MSLSILDQVKAAYAPAFLASPAEPKKWDVRKTHTPVHGTFLRLSPSPALAQTSVLYRISFHTTPPRLARPSHPLLRILRMQTTLTT